MLLAFCSLKSKGSQIAHTCTDTHTQNLQGLNHSSHNTIESEVLQGCQKSHPTNHIKYVWQGCLMVVLQRVCYRVALLQDHLSWQVLLTSLINSERLKRNSQLKCIWRIISFQSFIDLIFIELEPYVSQRVHNKQF